ncbi:MAG: ribonuclease III [Acidobacteriota bacterium]|nr:ribonuclease III [Acidobacteriota bacterium]
MAGSGHDHSTAALAELLESLPAELERQVFTHASWSERRSDSYGRLAFLGDSVLGLAVTAHLYPRLEPDRYGAGRLTKIRAHTVSGASCKKVALRLGIPERLHAAAPPGGGGIQSAELETERVLASVVEAVIGACYLAVGYERTAAAVVEAFAPEIEQALEEPLDFKSALQERLARDGLRAGYEVAGELGPPHRRSFEVAVVVDGARIGAGGGNSKKNAEQAAARDALERLRGER